MLRIDVGAMKDTQKELSKEYKTNFLNMKKYFRHIFANQDSFLCKSRTFTKR